MRLFLIFVTWAAKLCVLFLITFRWPEKKDFWLVILTEYSSTRAVDERYKMKYSYLVLFLHSFAGRLLHSEW